MWKWSPLGAKWRGGCQTFFSISQTLHFCAIVYIPPAQHLVHTQINYKNTERIVECLKEGAEGIDVRECEEEECQSFFWHFAPLGEA